MSAPDRRASNRAADAGPTPVAYPRCAVCAHSWHGLPCAVATSVGRNPTCSCPTSIPAAGAPTVGVRTGGTHPVAASSTHGHLWSLPDGTGLHAPRGVLARDPATGHVCCHLCGRWFVALGAHLRVHGWTARDYRHAMGLCTTTALIAPELSATISARQAHAYATDPAHRERLLPGQVMARTGDLAAASQAGRGTAVTDRLERTAARRRALAAGLTTQDAGRAAALAARLQEMGAADLSEHLRTAYAGGSSLADLARTTGLGRTRLRAAMAAAGVPVRAQGANTPAGRASRATTADHAAALRVGTTDVRAWLRRRREDGHSIQALAADVGRSAPWVRSRLAS